MILYSLDIGYGCLPVTQCDVNTTETCSDGKFLVHRQGDQILCCVLNFGLEVDKRVFDLHAIIEASKETNDTATEARSSFTGKLFRVTDFGSSH